MKLEQQIDGLRDTMFTCIDRYSDRIKEVTAALEELVRVVELDPRLSESYPLAQARAAIKKARGE